MAEKKMKKLKKIEVGKKKVKVYPQKRGPAPKKKVGVNTPLGNKKGSTDKKRRIRPSNFGRAWEETFLKALQEHGNVSHACKMACVTRKTAYDRRKNFPEFSENWDIAIENSVDSLEKEGRRRALAGSDNLIMFFLKAERPAKYRERYGMELTGKDGGPVEVKDSVTLEARRTFLLGVIGALSGPEKVGQLTHEESVGQS